MVNKHKLAARVGLVLAFSLIGALIVVTLIIAPMCVAIVIKMFASPDCGNTVLSTVKSPDGLHSATVYEVDCGMNVTSSTDVTVSDASQKVTPDDDDHVVFRAHSTNEMGLQWKSNNILIIHSSSNGPIPADEVVRRSPTWGRIQLIYK